MSRRLAAAWLGSLALAGTVGWALRGVTQAAPAAIARSAQPDAATVVQVQPDGRVTLRVEQRPLAWVLAQIALQTGRDPGATLAPAASAGPPELPRAVAAAAPAGAGLEEAAAEPGPTACLDMPDALHLQQTVATPGDDEARADALLRARAGGLTLPEALLRTLVEAGGHERLRVAALEAWLDQRAQGDAKSERLLLESVAHLHGAEVQQFVRQRLDDLDAIERLDAHASQGVASP